MTRETGHGFRTHHRIDNRLFDRLHRRVEDRIHALIRQHRDRAESSFGGSRLGICGRERNEQIARPVARCRPRARQAHRCPAGQPLQLIRHQRRVGRDRNDDGPQVFAKPWPSNGGARRHSVLNQFAHRNAGDLQLAAHSAIALHQNTDRVVTRAPGCRSDSALEPVADHARAAANIAFRYLAPLGCRDRLFNVLGLHVKSVDVVQIAVIGLGYNRQRPEGIAERVRAWLLSIARLRKSSSGIATRS